MSYYQQPSFQPPHYYPTTDNGGAALQRDFPPPNTGVYTSQPYQPYPMVAPQTTVFIYDDHPNFRQRDDSLLAALCAACLCCWLLPPFPTWHCWIIGRNLAVSQAKNDIETRKQWLIRCFLDADSVKRQLKATLVQVAVDARTQLYIHVPQANTEQKNQAKTHSTDFVFQTRNNGFLCRLVSR